MDNESQAASSRTLSYRDLETSLTGEFFWDETRPGPKPGILLIHGGAGLDEHARSQARRYAELGYAVLACDMLGDGVAGNRERVMGSIIAFRDDPALLVRRGQAGLTALSRCPEVGGPPAAVGFCFGGMAALTLARSGVNLAGAVSIHGTLSTGEPAKPGAVTAKILVCHGSADPHVPMEQVAAFTDEMNAAGADWQLVIYGQAVHGFTHRHAVPGAAPGVAYDAAADERSFAATAAFLAGVLGGNSFGPSPAGAS
ncbi:dienelactone hydrolase family protein [Nonomuraea jiangxiensis]|uniref:Dienelactone hydrolase n=1 Tax=Nonomuraea jiangxiensis TaxID=633440 RepID=A0A1G9DAC2_9ACTN|nr:dienelactone hydrolase family protein [Nonomuraea jiangxiensis]SDK60831.1 Dienelactone hydrolase [Nonomuraea jiangxiensis]